MRDRNQPTNPHVSKTHANDRAAGCTSPGCCLTPIDRRRFIQMAGAGAAALSTVAGGLRVVAGPFDSGDVVDHFVPADKKLQADWLRILTEKGQATVYRGKDLETIGMPVGGLCAGQVYLTGDGRLAHWDVFNWKTPGYGYKRETASPLATVEQGFALRVSGGGKTATRMLDSQGFPGVSFVGEYPIGQVRYEDPEFPVAATLEAFSPFIPLDAADSALPATIMQFTLANRSSNPVQATLAGWLENAVARHSAGEHSGDRINRVVVLPESTTVLGLAKSSPRPRQDRPPIVLADFEGGDYGDWKAEGEAFGTGPASGTLPRQQEVDGFQGKGLVNTFLDGDRPHGKLVSPPFTINRSFLSLLVGGGQSAGKTCANLLVGDKVVRTVTGANKEHLTRHNWNVKDLEGQEARIEIVDEESGAWGHINIDQIELTDRPQTSTSGPLEDQPDFGTMGLAVLTGEDLALASASLPEGALPQALFDGDGLADSGAVQVPFGKPLRGAVGQTVQLDPGEKKQVTFAVTWCFANRPPSGHFYATRFRDAAEVARYLGENLDRLASQTRLWHDTYYDSTLPCWLLDRLHSTVSTLATSTCEWWANGEFWAYEGVRCCQGTCGHVWNYEHALARLFPRLERSVREMQDFNPEHGFDAETGLIRFRGNWPDFFCGDSQPGYILKAYREHQASSDDAFLRRNWPNIKKAVECLFTEDANDDGLIEGQQHNTYDINFFGPNPMVGSLYLGALLAAEAMAVELADEGFAARCRKVFESGRKLSVEKLFNDEYFIQIVDLKEHPKHQFGDGCLSDQLFGQGWAHQVGLGYVYPKETVLAALGSIWKYNWAPDIAPQNKAHPPQRWFAHEGEAGLFTCTWPKSKHLGPESVLYRDEIWTGIEYQVAGHMAWEGMTTEALAICRGVDERYHPSKHNPWNEIECGDHYARGMAGWGVLLGLCGFEYHGPKHHIGFAPRISPEDFRAAFTAAEGWGTIDQKRDAGRQTNRVEVRRGSLTVKTLAVELPEGAKLAGATVSLASKPLAATATQDGGRVLITLGEAAAVGTDQVIEVELKC
jgi:uncharacterized protein (DUF608 family)